jgi:TonB-linked SusC/RagA family outer membrane protein
MRNSVRRILFSAGVFLALASSEALAQGIVVGRVIDRGNNTPVAGARVQVIGTNITGQTNVDGRFRFPAVPAGEQIVRVVALGFAAVNQTVTVVDGQTVTADIGLTLTPFSLDEMVVTATGDQSKREIGNSISTIDVGNLARTAPVASMGDLLAARAPGVQVMPGNITGGGSRVRIRGNSSFSLSNNPIYIVDGIRVWSDVNSSSIGIGGTNPSRVNDINPEEIESIDVIKGPSASTLYGTDAANGVIVIKTKRGKAGRTVWNAYTEQGFNKSLTEWPTAYRAWRTGTTSGTTSSATNTVQCLINQILAATCRPDSVSSFNIFEDKDASPNGTGHRQQYGLQVGGGSDVATYQIMAEWEDETGYLKMPKVFAERLLANRSLTELPSEVNRPNALRKTNLRANVTAQLSQKFDVQVSTGYVSSTQRLPQTDNNTTGLLSNGLGGPGFKNNLVTTGGQPQRNNYGFRLYTPDEFFSETVTQDINRTLASTTANFRPTSWLSFRAVAGVDFTSREDSDICRRDECVPFTGNFPYKVGFKENNRTTNWVYSGDVSSTANYSVLSNVRARTTAGVQYNKERFVRNGAFAYDLTPGATTVSAGATPSADEATTENAILGYFGEQWFGWNDRVFLTLGLRTDRNNAFGRDFKRVYYPKVALSWVTSDESWFPEIGMLTNFRLRGAFGASGRQPGTNDAIPFFSPSTASLDGVDIPSLVFSAVGNTSLKPERSTELELGFDAGLFNSRVNLELTYYDKRSKDALISRPLPPSQGTAGSRFENLGEIQNKGWEAVLNAVLIDTRQVGWDLTIAGSKLTNRVLDMGGLPPIRGTTNSTIEGYSLSGYWLRPLSFKDANGDGMIALSEITVGDTTEYVGDSQPTEEITLYTGLELFSRKVRLSANLDFKGGAYQNNGTDRIRCESRLNCRGTVDPKAPLWEQARAVAVRQHASRTQTGFVEKMDFLRFREVAATWTMPAQWAQLLYAQAATLTFAARNIGFLSNYSGMDPETGYFASNSGTQSDFQSAPPPSYFTFRLNLTF